MPYVRDTDFARVETIILSAIDVTEDKRVKDLLRRALDILDKYKLGGERREEGRGGER